jgi:dCMP deaminase
MKDPENNGKSDADRPRGDAPISRGADDSPYRSERERFPVLQIDHSNRRPILRPSWDDYFLDIAEAVSRRSHDGETQVGAVIVDPNKRILATGYNGFPPGCNDRELPNLRPDKYPYMVHAEINAIASSRQDLRGATLYCTWSPCRDCAKAVITAGIARVVFRKAYKNDDFGFVLDLLIRCGIEATDSAQ